MNLSPALRRVFGISLFQKFFAWSILIILLFLLRSFLGLFLITFIFAYIFYGLARSLVYQYVRWSNHMQKKTLLPSKRYINVAVTGLYIFFVFCIILALIRIVPLMAREIHDLTRQAPFLAASLNEMVEKTELSLGLNLWLTDSISSVINAESIKDFGTQILIQLRNIWGIILKVFIWLILSYIFLMERDWIRQFIDRMRIGSFAFLYREYALIGEKVVQGFWRIMEAQMFIALINAVLTALGLIGISLVHGGSSFPYIFTLSSIVFVFGFIPVLGMFISGIPIIIVGYWYGAMTWDQWMIVLACVSMLIVIHAIEAYYLNPKIVSSYMHFPVFITFLILLISESMFGFVWLIIGIPLFSILLSLLKDMDVYLRKGEGDAGSTP